MLLGREKEIEILSNSLKKDESSFIAIYGRRRIGKTYLVNEFFKNKFTFKCSGTYGEKTSFQLEMFNSSLMEAGLTKFKKPKDWIEAFDLLKKVIDLSKDKKKVIFIDELSWLDQAKGKFIKCLENFWNSWCYGRKDVVLIICSSSSSWILDKVIHNKGGLYNRLTDLIYLKPFSLKECLEYSTKNELFYNKFDVLEAYMVFGGIPYYWSKLKPNLSLSLNIDNLFFNDNAILKDEYNYIFSYLFDSSQDYQKIIDALYLKKSGLTRKEIIKNTKITDNGHLSKKLNDLEYSGFINKFNKPNTSSKEVIYQLIDNYVLFFKNFLVKNNKQNEFYSKNYNTPLLNTWRGLAFEIVVLEHIESLKKVLGINGIYSEAYSCFYKKDENKGIEGSQIDLILLRSDRNIDLFEIKYSLSRFKPTKQFENSLNSKINDLNIDFNGKYSINPILVTLNGIVKNEYSRSIKKVLTLNDLFN